MIIINRTQNHAYMHKHSIVIFQSIRIWCIHEHHQICSYVAFFDFLDQNSTFSFQSLNAKHCVFIVLILQSQRSAQFQEEEEKKQKEEKKNCFYSLWTKMQNGETTSKKNTSENNNSNESLHNRVDYNTDYKNRSKNQNSAHLCIGKCSNRLLCGTFKLNRTKPMKIEFCVFSNGIRIDNDAIIILYAACSN